MRERQPGRRRRRFLILLVLFAVTFAALATFRVGAAPEIVIQPELPGIGKRTPVRVVLGATGRGLSRVKVSLIQGDRKEVLKESEYVPRPPWAFWGTRTVSDSIELEIGSETVDRLKQGEATVRVEAFPPPTWLQQPPPTVAELNLPVQLRPPSLSVISNQHYPAQGGCEAVVYRVGETAVVDGVRVGESWFPGAPLPGGMEGDRMALFGIPFDHDDVNEIRLVAEDAVGNVALFPFVDRFFPRDFNSDDVEVPESFMAKAVPEILANTPELDESGNLVDDYIAINRDLRRSNSETLRELASKSPPRFLWQSPFLPMPNAKVMSDFADRRTYFHRGQEIDRQDHLGFDLASIQHAPVPAGNTGRVVLAEYFGIYGNTVAIDHGLGLISLYGHLSLIEVAEGEAVERGRIVGRTGQTGLAAGDHLHFTMLLHGEAINPIEWWDGDWIRNRLKRKLGGAMPFSG